MRLPLWMLISRISFASWDFIQSQKLLDFLHDSCLNHFLDNYSNKTQGKNHRFLQKNTFNPVDSKK